MLGRLVDETWQRERNCKVCGKAFRAKSKPGPRRTFEYCSRSCSDAGKIKHERHLERTCATCGAIFTDKHAGRTEKFCSRKCFCERKQAEYVKCVWCGNEFVNRRLDRNPGREFCSRECAFEEKKVLGSPAFRNNPQYKMGSALLSVNAWVSRHTRYASECVMCGKVFAHKHKNRGQNVCSSKCKYQYMLAWNRSQRVLTSGVVEIDCGVCGKRFLDTKRNVRYCGVACRKIMEKRNHKEMNHMHARRLRAARRHGERFGKSEVYMRDGYRCGICGRKVRMNVKWDHPLAPTLDHIIPICDGGEHTRRNVRTAHFICNSKRGAGRHVVDQLLLIG